MPTKQQQILVEFNQAFNSHNVDAMMQLMSADCLFENTYPPPDGTRYSGQDEVRAFWQAFFAASPGARIDVEEMFGESDKLCQRWVYSWQGQQPGHVRGVDVFHIRDGRIVGKFSFVKG